MTQYRRQLALPRDVHHKDDVLLFRSSKAGTNCLGLDHGDGGGYLGGVRLRTHVKRVGL